MPLTAGRVADIHPNYRAQTSRSQATHATRRLVAIERRLTLLEKS